MKNESLVVNKNSVLLVISLFILNACSHQELSLDITKPDYFILDNEGLKLTSKQLENKLLSADVIYLGEIHDNPDHHVTQLDIIQKLLDSGKKPVIGFEFFSREQSSWLLNFTTASKHSFRPLKAGKAGELLRHRLGWNDREDWNYYFPFLELAKKNELQVFGADLDKGIRIRMARTGIEQMLGIEKASLPKNVGEDQQEYKQLIFEELRSGHCNMASDDLVKKLYKTITLRNAYMAESINSMINDADEKQPIVIILGRGHVNYDSGVKSQLAFINPELSQLNIGIYENRNTKDSNFTSELVKHVKGVIRHNLYALTKDRKKAAVDHCAAFKKHSKK